MQPVKTLFIAIAVIFSEVTALGQSTQRQGLFFSLEPGINGRTNVQYSPNHNGTAPVEFFIVGRSVSGGLVTKMEQAKLTLSIGVGFSKLGYGLEFSDFDYPDATDEGIESTRDRLSLYELNVAVKLSKSFGTGSFKPMISAGVLPGLWLLGHSDFSVECSNNQTLHHSNTYLPPFSFDNFKVMFLLSAGVQKTTKSGQVLSLEPTFGFGLRQTFEGFNSFNQYSAGINLTVFPKRKEKKAFITTGTPAF